MWTLGGVILVCSLIQSLFGVGLLVFGTPALLAAGVPFARALFYLLPCSISVSLLQLNDDSGVSPGFRSGCIRVLAPAAALGALFPLLAEGRLDIRLAVGVMLLLSAALRASEPLRSRVAGLIAPKLGKGLAIVGFLHGMTNMGGGLLAVLVNSLFVNKREARAHIALGYLILASIQMLVLLVLKGPQDSPLVPLVLSGLCAIVYLLAGRKAFSMLPQAAYQRSMTALMALAGALLLGRP